MPVRPDSPEASAWLVAPVPNLHRYLKHGPGEALTGAAEAVALPTTTRHRRLHLWLEN